ncbi:hypothetical protein LSAT2_022669 [Lamellibrachia satsuma]|nr:hypothetical protein LSAT2_022669 [Lamellibrachia satsuma]
MVPKGYMTRECAWVMSLMLQCQTLALLLILIDNVTSSVHYTNKWAAYIPGGQRVAEQVAATFGYRNHGQFIICNKDVQSLHVHIGALDGYYLLVRRQHPRRSRRAARRYTRVLIEDDRRKTERQRDKGTDRQVDTERGGQRDRWKEGQWDSGTGTLSICHRRTERHRYRETGGEWDIDTDREWDIETERYSETEGQRGREIARQRDRRFAL